MEHTPKRWKVLDKKRLLLVLMEELAGNAHISFEGDLKRLALQHLPDASNDPTEALKRNTLWPKQDFIIVPLEPSMSKNILAAIGGTVPKSIIHIQIEKNGVLEFGAYDNFHPESIYLGKALDQGIIDSLVAEGIIRSYGQRRSERSSF